jgi:energy-coupling factor transporter ATP-binding protein EcfA2
MTDAPALQMRGIVKAFPGVVALDHVDFDCFAGEVHAICGENGAGKSTLMKILGGSYRPDAGEIRIRDRPMRFTHPVEARAAGISVIHQELNCCLTAAWRKTSLWGANRREEVFWTASRCVSGRPHYWLSLAPAQIRISASAPCRLRASNGLKSPKRCYLKPRLSLWTNQRRRSVSVILNFCCSSLETCGRTV